MKSNRKFWWGCAAVVSSVLALSACGGGGGGGGGGAPVANVNTVPDSAGATTASFLAFIQALALNDETSEPLVFGSSLAAPVEDLTEPAPVA